MAPCYCIGPWYGVDPTDRPAFVDREHRTDDPDCFHTERDPITAELVVEAASPDPLAGWSDTERRYAFGDR